jgi:hypothetical protein
MNKGWMLDVMWGYACGGFFASISYDKNRREPR